MMYEWYEQIAPFSNEFQQGDLIPECPIVIPPKDIFENQTTSIEIQLIDSIVLSQSCDLANNKIEIVLVCPFYSLNYFLSHSKDQSKKNRQKRIDELRKGNLPGFHLLNKQENTNFSDDFLVVDFKNIYGINIVALTDIVCKIDIRYRLLSPYREHLSQSFARYFMRVGLPQDINIPDDYLK